MSVLDALRGEGPSPYSLRILGGLQGGGKHVYAAPVPVPPAVVARRRAANRAARRQRRVNRLRGAR